MPGLQRTGRSYSESEDDLESMGTITMADQMQPLSAYVPLDLGANGMRNNDEISVFLRYLCGKYSWEYL